MRILAGAGAFTAPAAGSGVHWAEQLRASDLSVGTYSVPAGGTDDQEPHTEDEIYVVTSGRARLVAGGQSAPVGTGAVIYVPAGEEHRFTDVTEDLALLVLFAPAEYTRRPGGPPA
ncbi:MAG TPA: cupin domain-containing protein [Streptosporangiaceae bacterium]|nr:cupin domain-containing protein [Streptosporangiaceae bacterium]